MYAVSIDQELKKIIQDTDKLVLSSYSEGVVRESIDTYNDWLLERLIAYIAARGKQKNSKFCNVANENGKLFLMYNGVKLPHQYSLKIDQEEGDVTTAKAEFIITL